MNKRILIVDDEPDILKVVVFRLKKLGCEILVAVDGQQGFDMVCQEKPDLVILDLLLPTIDGYEICKRIKSDDTLKKIPVILLTASTVGDLAERARMLNANDYMIKPFDTEELLSKVKKHLFIS